MDGATLEEVAREARISKGAIYFYFLEKRTLITAMVRAWLPDLLPPASGIRVNGSAQTQLDCTRH